MLNDAYNFTSKLEGNCIFFIFQSVLSFLPIIYHKHYWMMSVKRPHEEVTMYHLENKSKFEVSDNISVTPSVQKKVIGNTTTPSDKIQ